MHSTMMLFTEMGRLYWIKVYDLPEGNRQSKGRAIQNVINLQKGDRVCTFINVKGLNDPDFVNNHYLIFATKNGLMKKTTLEAYSRPRANGIIALGLREGDELIGVTLTDGESQMLIASYNGKVVRFPENTVRPMGRTATGVRAIKLDEDGQDHAIGMICVEGNSEETVLVISDKGFGKRTLLDDENGEPIYRITNRGGKGVKTMNLTDKTGQLVGLHAVTDDEDLMLITKSGTAIRMAMDSIRVMGRATQGVKLIELQKRNDVLMFGCVVPKEEEEEAPVESAENAESAETENTNE
jgi:DNA gyrase subunit A